MNIWVVTPTYNERANLRAHVGAILEILPTANVLIVDDASPDGTGELADELERGSRQIHVLHRAGKLGLGSAYAEGCALALQRGAEVVCQMDADGSHQVELLAVMLNEITQADLVLASRYVRGGSMNIDPLRRCISSLGNTYIRWLLGPRVHDWSTGYKAWRASTLQRVLATRPQAHGYAWLMETSWLALQQGARIYEVPLVFGSRKNGESKFSWDIAWEDLRVAWGLRRRTLAKSFKK